MSRKQMTLRHLRTKQQQGEKITMLTCYDAAFAHVINETDVDMILVGDSVAMVCHGFPDTTHANMAMMVMHTQAVARAKPRQLIVSDLPFLSYRKGLAEGMEAVDQLLKAGAHAIKLEGLAGNEAFISHLVESGVPVMGHLGLTPQHVHQMGGYVIQGRGADQQKQLLSDAKKLQNLGCFAIVLECIPASLAAEITKATDIPTIGIGAGPEVDGQVLVLHDLLGISGEALRFVKPQMHARPLVHAAIQQYCAEVNTAKFPQMEHAFHD